MLPIVIVKDRRSGLVASHPVPSKGIGHPHAAKALLRDVERTGYSRLVFRYDQEPFAMALCAAVRDAWSGKAVVESSPVGESRSNGQVERALQEVQG